MTTSGRDEIAGLPGPTDTLFESQESHAVQNLPNHDLDPHAPPFTTTPTLPSSTLPSSSSSGSGSNRSLLVCLLVPALSRVFGPQSLEPGLSTWYSLLTLRPYRGAGDPPPPGTHLGTFTTSCASLSLLKNQVQGQRDQRGRGRKEGEPQKNQNKTGNVPMHLGDPPCTHFLHN